MGRKQVTIPEQIRKIVEKWQFLYGKCLLCSHADQPDEHGYHCYSDWRKYRCGDR